MAKQNADKSDKVRTYWNRRAFLIAEHFAQNFKLICRQKRRDRNRKFTGSNACQIALFDFER